MAATGGGIARPLLVASGLLNALLVLALLAREQLDSSMSAARPAFAGSSWCQPRPTALLAQQQQQPQQQPGQLELAAHAPPPPADSIALAAPLSKSYSADEARLKRIWYHPPCGQPGALPCNSRSYKEAHDARWTFLSDRLISRGLASAGDPLRLRCLGEKLLKGLPTHLSVLGGSVSFGTTFTTSKSRALFHWKVYQYLNSSFPRAAHEHYMGAVPASGPSYMEHCVMWHLPPPGADLILVEYAVNFDGQDDFAPFERLIRRLLRLPNHPAIVIVNTAELVPPNGRLPFEPDANDYPSERDLAFEYRSTGAEDAINAIANYYGVPTVSLRGALFSELKANSSAFPIKQIYHDRHHPSAWGHSLMAQMVVDLVERAIDHAKAGASSSSGSGACAVASQEMRGVKLRPGPQLWNPLFSRGDEAPVGACFKDHELEKRIHKASGFKYVVEGVDAKMKPGIVGYKAGDSVQFCVDVDRLDPGASFVFILGHLISYEHMGAAQVSCIDACGCESQEVDAHVPGGKFSVFKARTFHAKKQPLGSGGGGGSTRGPCGCKVEVTILPKSGSGEYKFKVLSLMTASKEGSLRYGHQAGFNNRPTEARFS